MKVRHLISALTAFDLDAEVLIPDDDEYGWPAVAIQMRESGACQFLASTRGLSPEERVFGYVGDNMVGPLYLWVRAESVVR